MQYRREIDGLRAVAILPVILFHAGFGMFSGGFVGVDVFFVISGYLITTLIISEKQAGQFSLLHFYERRARRILPALFFMMLICLPFAWWWMLPEDLAALSRSVVAVPLFVSNILFRKETGYFETAAELKPLLHTWSLAIEEQYYVIFPLLVMLVWRVGMKRITWLLIVLALGSLVWAEWKLTRKPPVAFYLLPARAWELLVGALTAIHLLQTKQPLSKALCQTGATLGLLLIVYAITQYDSTTRFPGLHALAPTMGTALIILCARKDHGVGALLSTPLLVGIGLISYSAYLWHHPVFALARIRDMNMESQPLIIGLCLLSLAMAYLSWRYVETPFRARSRFTRRQIFGMAATGSACFILLGWAGQKTRGFEEFFYAHRLTPHEQQLYSTIKTQTGGSMYDDMGDDGACNFWARNIDDSFVQRFDTCRRTHGKALFVLGDSHAMNIYNALFRTQTAPFMVGLSQGGCRPHDNNPGCHYDGFDAFLKTHQSAISLLVFHQSGSYLLQDHLGRVDSAETFAKGKPYTIHHDNIEKTITYLNRLSNAVPVVWLGPFVEARFNFKNLRHIAAHGFAIAPNRIDIFKSLDETLTTRTQEKTGMFVYLSMVDLLNITPEFLKQGDCITYRDRDHFSICGEKMVGERIKKPLLRRSNSHR